MALNKYGFVFTSNMMTQCMLKLFETQSNMMSKSHAEQHNFVNTSNMMIKSHAEAHLNTSAYDDKYILKLFPTSGKCPTMCKITRFCKLS